MRSAVSTLLLALALAGPVAPVYAADPAPLPKSGPKFVKSSVNVPGTVVGPAKSILSFKVNNPDKLELVVVCQSPETKFTWFREASDDPTVASFKVFAATDGEYYMTFLVVDGSKPAIVGQVKIIAGTPLPDPKPPGPNPNPDVNPPLDPAPIPADGLHVLIVIDTATTGELPISQQSVIYGKTTRDYLNSKSPLGPDGKTHQWRIWDQDTDASNEQQLWQDALKRAKDKISAWKPAADGKGPKKSVPWVIISNGKTGYEGPLPATLDEMTKLLKTYGG